MKRNFVTSHIAILYIHFNDHSASMRYKKKKQGLHIYESLFIITTAMDEHFLKIQEGS